MIVKVKNGIPGSGKTLGCLDVMVQNSSRYLLAGPRTELLDEHADYINTHAIGSKVEMSIIPVHSKQGERSDVDRRIRDAVEVSAAYSHRVIIITHVALTKLQPHDFVGWNVVIDEVPDNAVESGIIDLRPHMITLQHHYDIVPSNVVGWWEAKFLPSVDQPDYAGITSGKDIDFKKFQLCLRSGRTVLLDVSDWRDAHKGRKVRWWSIWTPLSLSGATSVTITGTGFYHSLAYYAAMKVHPNAMTFEDVPSEQRLPRGNPRIRVHHFTQHEGSTEWWSSDDGGRCLVEISRYFETLNFSGYWSCNAEISDYFRHRFPGDFCKPKLAGTNALRHHAKCAIIYSNKAREQDSAILEILGLSRRDIQIAREHEDLTQFIMRGAIRDPSFEGEYDIFVYCERQAEGIVEYLTTNRISGDVEVVPVELGALMDIRRPEVSGRSEVRSDQRTHAERVADDRKRECERKQRQRARDRAKRQEAGTLRPRGRPKKAG